MGKKKSNLVKERGYLESILIICHHRISLLNLKYRESRDESALPLGKVIDGCTFGPRAHLNVRNSVGMQVRCLSRKR